MAPAFDSSVSSEHGGNVMKGQGPPSEDNDTGSGLPVLTLRNRLTALIIDSNSPSRMLQRGLLRHYGVETKEVESGQAALNLIASRSDQFDLIIIDNSLPSVFNGLNAIRAMRRMGVTSRIVGMVMCWCPRVTEGYMCGCRPDVLAVLGAGATEVIFKPLNPETLVAILRDLDN